MKKILLITIFPILLSGCISSKSLFRIRKDVPSKKSVDIVRYGSELPAGASKIHENYTKVVFYPNESKLSEVDKI